MAAGRNDQILRFLVQAEGADALKPFLESVKELEGASDETRKAADALLQELESAAGISKTLGEFEKLSATLGRTKDRYEAAKVQVDALAKQMQATEQPSKRQTEEFGRAEAALARLGAQYAVQDAKLSQLSTELKSAGLATNNFVAAQAQINAKASQASQALTQLATAARSTKTEQEQLAARLADGDEAFRRQVESSRSAREALDRVKASTTAAAQAQQDAAGKSTVLGAAWTKLAAIGATLVGYLSINAAVQGVKNLLGLADASEKTRIRLAALYGSQEAGNKAFADLRALSQATGQEFAATAEAAARLKSFGIEPLNGSLQALIDQNARVGGSQETLNGLILAVGQAWAKQKLQGEEILQLVERGVPVWDLLAKATGKNTIELQKLSEAGKLGRTEIAALVREIGASAQGAAAQNLGTFGGLIVQLKDQWQQFLQAIADAGVLDYAKQQISGLIDTAKRLAQDGTLTQWAKSTADGIKTVANVIGTALKTTYEYSSAIIALGQAYATIKVAQLVADLGLLIARKYAAATAATALGTATAGASAAMGGLGAAIGRIPTAVQVGIGIVGLEAAYSGINKLTEAYAQLRDAQAKLNIEREDLGAGEAKLIAQIDELRAKYSEYADTAIRSSAELRALSNDQAEAYRQQLEGAQRYFRALEVDARRANDVAGFQGARQKVIEFQTELDRVKERFANLAAETTVVQPKINEFAQSLITAFQTAYKEGSNAAQVIREEFGKIDVSTVKGLTDAIEAIREIGKVSTEAGAALEADLREKLKKLSDEDLKRVREVAEATFKKGSEEAKAFGKAVAGINLERLGVDLDAIRTGFSSAGGAAVAAFKGAIDEVEKLGLTAEQQSAAISQAFDAAFSRAGTRPELEALREQLKAAFNGGKISAAEYERALAQLNARLDELAGKSSTAATNTRNVASAIREAKDAADAAGDSVDQLDSGIGNVANRSAEAAQTVATFTDAITAMDNAAQTADSSAFQGNRLFIQSINRRIAANKELMTILDQRIEQEKRLAMQADESAQIEAQLIARYGNQGEKIKELARLIEQNTEKTERDTEALRRNSEELKRNAEARAVAAGTLGTGSSAPASDGSVGASGGKGTVVELIVRGEQSANGPAPRLSGDQLNAIARTVIEAIRLDMRSAGR